MRAVVVTGRLKEQSITVVERVSFRLTLPYPRVSSHGHDFQRHEWVDTCAVGLSVRLQSQRPESPAVAASQATPSWSGHLSRTRNCKTRLLDGTRGLHCTQSISGTGSVMSEARDGHRAHRDQSGSGSLYVVHILSPSSILMFFLMLFQGTSYN